MGAAKNVKIPFLYKFLYTSAILGLVLGSAFIYTPLFLLIIVVALIDLVLHKTIFDKKLRAPFFEVVVPFKTGSPDGGWYYIEEGETFTVLDNFSSRGIAGSEYKCDSGMVLQQYRRAIIQVDRDSDSQDMVIGHETMNLCCRLRSKWYERLYK